MRLSLVLLAKKPKSKHVMVQLESLVSGHRFSVFRERLADKVELFRFDPWIQQEAFYREKKKIKSCTMKRFKPIIQNDILKE